MIKEIKVYTCICDNCKTNLLDGSDYSGVDIDWIGEELDEQNWHVIEGQGKNHLYYCCDCWSWDDNDQIQINTSRFKP